MSMYCNIALYVWLAFTTTFSVLIPTLLAQTDTYIVHMDSSAMPSAFSTHHSWHLATLSSVLAESKTTSSITATAASSSRLLYTYTHVINGFSACLSPTDLEILKTRPGYISSSKDVSFETDTTRSPDFLGLNPNFGAWKVSNYGEGIIIGVLDTGVWPESESFKDKGMPDIPKRWKGKCESGTQFNSSLCNKKLIGARSFNKGAISNNPDHPISMNSTRDTDGHGTHTSSTAAGNFVEGASFFGYAKGTARGVAARAHVAMYKTLWIGGSFASDTIAAIDQAIIDGVDVLSISFSRRKIPLHEDPIALATFTAVEKNIFVSASAGNRGYSHLTVENGAPWILTVAASTIDRQFNAILRLGNGVSVTGLAIYPGSFPSSKLPIVLMKGNCSLSEEFSDVGKKIAVREETIHTSLDSQVFTARGSNVSGAIFITNSTELDSFLPTQFPAVFLSLKDGETLKNYINSSTRSQASIEFSKTVLTNKAAPSLAHYSSRGPYLRCPFVLKPDIMAPGNLILAAWPENRFVGIINGKEIFIKFDFSSGTSMAAPHAAGVAALLKKAHPDWSPAAIRSAMMTTADTVDHNNEPFKDTGLFNWPATPFGMGAGQINPNKALDPGLIYDLNSTDYVNLLCALNFTQSQIKTFTKSPSNHCSSPSLDLNYPSFIAFFNEKESDSNLTAVQEFHRTVTNVGDAVAIYTARLTPIKGLNVSVVPEKLIFKAKKEKLSYKLVIKGPKRTEQFVSFGYLSWVDSKGKHIVKSPIGVANFNVEDYE